MIRMIFIPVAVVSVLKIQNYSMFSYLCRAAVNNRFELTDEKYFCTPFSFFSDFDLQEAKSYCTKVT